MDVYALFDDVMVKLRERQTLDGGFTTWSVPGAKPDAYDSVYAAHFLVKAREHDFNVPENMLKKALSYCEEQAGRSPEGPEDMVPAYAAYVLTLGGKVTTNYLLNLEEYYKANYEKAGGKVWEQVLWRQAISCFRMKTRRGDWSGSISRVVIWRQMRQMFI